MGDITQLVAGERWRGWRIAMWGAAAILLSLPAIAMQFTSDVNWTASDFVVMGTMLGTACMACEAAARVSGSGSYRVATGIAVGVAFVTVWANLAVGMIGDEGNSLNLLFGGVLALALVGSIVADFRPAGMARTMVVTGVAQGLAGAAGLFTDPRGAAFSMAFALPWLLSACQFRKASREP
jgi:hypothetical protein